MEWSIIFPLPALRFTQKPGGFPRTNSRWPGRCLTTCCLWGSFDRPVALSHHLFTWFQRQTSHGGPVETTGASTMRQYPTGTRCLTNKTQRQQDTTSPVNFLVFSDKLFTTPNQPSWMTRIHLRRLPSGREEDQRRFLLRDQSVHYIFGGRCFNDFFFLLLLPICFEPYRLVCS